MSTKNPGHEPGILYIRYNKNSLEGIAVEKLKKQTKKNIFGKKVLEMILIDQGVEILDINDLDRQTLESIYWNCIEYFAAKLAKVKVRLNTGNNNQYDSELASFNVNVDAKKNLANDYGYLVEDSHLETYSHQSKQKLKTKPKKENYLDSLMS